MNKKFSNLIILGGVAMVAVSNSIFVVDPGEKGLIMNQIRGLKQKIYHQGYNFKLPVFEVNTSIASPQSYMKPD